MGNSGFRFLESAGGAAILTVFFGTLGGTILNSCIQKGVRERERELAAYESHLQQERTVVESVYALIGSTMAAGESIIALAGFQRASFVGVRLERFEVQEFDLSRAYTESQSRWRGNRYVLALQMDYYHPRDESMADAWDLVAAGVDEFLKCAEKWHSQSGNGVDTSEACAGERNGVRARLDHLTRILERARVYPWVGSGWPNGHVSALFDCLARAQPVVLGLAGGGVFDGPNVFMRCLSTLAVVGAEPAGR